MAFRGYVQRSRSGEWIDTDVIMRDFSFTTRLSGPVSGKAIAPEGVRSLRASDGRLLWEKWGSNLLLEEDGRPIWFGVCTDANPAVGGMGLEFIGLRGWLAGVDFQGTYRTWQRDVFEVLREITRGAHMNRGLDWSLNLGNSGNRTVGDPEPDPEPVQRGRLEGETDEQWEAYIAAFRAAREAWDRDHGWKKRYELLEWEAPYIGDELDSLAKETGVQYRERITWHDRKKLEYRLFMDMDADLANRRTDIEFVDGSNIMNPLNPKNDSTKYANHVIGLGSGEGRDMLRAVYGEDDGRLYQAQTVGYKSINNETRLRNLIQADHKVLSSLAPKVDRIEVRDMPGYSGVNTILPGDEVRVRSANTAPNINDWYRVVEITRTISQPNQASFGLETVG